MPLFVAKGCFMNEKGYWHLVSAVCLDSVLPSGRRYPGALDVNTQARRNVPFGGSSSAPLGIVIG